MYSTKRFTANFEMHASLPPGMRSCAPDEETTTIYPFVFSKASTAALAVVFIFEGGQQAVNESALRTAGKEKVFDT
jgi:hypothetical protein